MSHLLTHRVDTWSHVQGVFTTGGSLPPMALRFKTAADWGCRNFGKLRHLGLNYYLCFLRNKPIKMIFFFRRFIFGYDCVLTLGISFSIYFLPRTLYWWSKMMTDIIGSVFLINIRYSHWSVPAISNTNLTSLTGSKRWLQGEQIFPRWEKKKRVSLCGSRFTPPSVVVAKRVNSGAGVVWETKSHESGAEWGNVLELHTADDPPWYGVLPLNQSKQTTAVQSSITCEWQFTDVSLNPSHLRWQAVL